MIKVRFISSVDGEALPDLVATQGDPGKTETKRALGMMQFLSNSARAVRQQITTDSVHFPGYGW